MRWKRLKALLREFFTATWFMIRGDQAVTHTRKGSRPGDAFADLVFSFALTKFVQRAFEQLQVEFNDLGIWWNGEKTIYPQGDSCIDLGPLTPTWADDLAFAVNGSDPEHLVHKITRVTSILFEHLLAAGLTPNLKKGKSEILIDLRGQGSLAVKRRLLLQDNLLQVESRFGTFELHLVGSYRHLGTWLQVGAGIQKDISCKFALAHDVLTRYKSQLFCNRGLDFPQKKQYFVSLVLSTVMYSTTLLSGTQGLASNKSCLKVHFFGCTGASRLCTMGTRFSSGTCFDCWRRFSCRNRRPC